MKKINVLLLILFAFTGNASGSDWGAVAGGGSHGVIPWQNWFPQMREHGILLQGSSVEGGIAKFKRGTASPSWSIQVGREKMDLGSDRTSGFSGVFGSPGQLNLTRLTVRKYFQINFSSRLGLMPYLGGGMGWGQTIPNAANPWYQPMERVVPVPELGLLIRVNISSHWSLGLGINATPIPAAGGKTFVRF